MISEFHFADFQCNDEPIYATIIAHEAISSLYILMESKTSSAPVEIQAIQRARAAPEQRHQFLGVHTWIHVQFEATQACAGGQGHAREAVGRNLLDSSGVSTDQGVDSGTVNLGHL